MALGADRSRVLLLFLGQGMRLALLGVTLGVLLTLGVTRALGSFLFGIAPTDFFTLAGAGALLAAVALIASWVPAFRGARVDPTVALQSD
jgi:ABC-type antimicrobial peptide transport system permease subunit